MSGIAETIHQPDQLAVGKCARDGCDVHEGQPHPATGKTVGCLKVAAAVPGKGVVQWCSMECYEADHMVAG